MAKHFKNKQNVVRRYGWIPSSKKPTNFYEPPHMARLPSSIDLQSQCPAVYNQGNLGSCTANAAAGLAQFLMKKRKLADWAPSRLALYYWNRLQEGTVNEDSGASLYDAMETMVKYGVPHESLWPYDVNNFAVKPTKNVWSDAYWHMIKQGLSVGQNMNAIKICLASGYPIIFGFSVYESFDRITSNGIMPMPNNDEEIFGGHAVMAVGYNDSTKMIKVRNSWGTRWGKNGYFFMPYNFLTNPNYCDDFWTANVWTRFQK